MTSASGKSFVFIVCTMQQPSVAVIAVVTSRYMYLPGGGGVQNINAICRPTKCGAKFNPVNKQGFRSILISQTYPYFEALRLGKYWFPYF